MRITPLRDVYSALATMFATPGLVEALKTKSAVAAQLE
jgi:hypothetical protein